MKQNIKEFKSKIASILKDAEENIIISVLDNSSSTCFTLEEFINHFNPEEIQKGLCHFVFSVDYNGNKIATWVIKDMLGCAGILIFTDLFVRRDFRNKKIGTLISSFIPEFSKYYGYGIIQCTDNTKNEITGKIMKRLEWELSHSFPNPKTGNQVNLWLCKTKI